MEYGTPIVSSSNAIKNLAARFAETHGSLVGFNANLNQKAYLAPLSK